MATVKVEYVGDLRTEATHLKSNTTIQTDAPTDNHGKGESFSPTDLVVTALGGCIMTIMAIKSEDLGIELKGSVINATKIMSEDLPRRIQKIEMEIALPSGVQPKDRKILEAVAATCPVAKSLSSDLEKEIVFNWG